MKREKKGDMIIQIEKIPIIEVACAKVGISRMTHYRWLKEDKEYKTNFFAAMDEGLVRISDMAETQLINLIKKEKLGAVVYWLRHRHPAYRNRLEVEVHGDAEEDLSPEEQEVVDAGVALGGISVIRYDQAENRSGDSPDHAGEPARAESGREA